MAIWSIGTWPGPSTITWQPRDLGPPGQLAQGLELGELGGVGCVGDAAGPQAVAQAEGDVVLPHDVAQVVEVRVERVFLAVGEHPLGHQRPAARDDPGDAMGRQRDVVAEDAGVDRHVVDALLGLVLDHVEHVAGREVLDLLDLLDRLVDRHGADRDRAGGDDRPADRVDIAAGREVHHGVGAEVDGHLELGELVVDVGGDGRVADVGVDLAPRLDADAPSARARAARWTVLAGMIIRPARHFRADQLGIERLAAGDVVHLVGDHPLPGHFDLRHGAKIL